LLHRAYQAWSELEEATGETLFVRTGLLLVGRPNGVVVPGVRRSAAEHGLSIEHVPVFDVARRFPGFTPHDDMEALFERDAGYLRAELCVRSLAGQAVARGAVLRAGEVVQNWGCDSGSVTVRTDRGEYAADRLIVCGGAWAAKLLADLSLPLQVRRKVVLWFRVTDPVFRPERGCPAFCFDTADGFYYGFPMISDGEIKVSEHTGGQVTPDADELDRDLYAADQARLWAFLAEHMPRVTPTVVRHSVCMYTMTPDEDFIIDRHPTYPNVVFAAGFSGHGFKFAPVVGEALADLATAGRTELPIDFLSAARFHTLATKAQRHEES
jgi:monomeric sarcosine oxidase